ncbi:hypothetical protein GQ457_01G014640 [Hibiscus cannabinus]
MTRDSIRTNLLILDKTTKHLLQKIADLALEDYPYVILEDINCMWENWNSPKSHVSNNSMNLDEMEKVNLANVHEN